MKIIRRIFDYKAVPILAGVFAILFIAESKRPLRKRKTSRPKRVVINSIASIPAFSLLRLILLPVMVKLALINKKFQVGLTYRYTASPFVKGLVTFLILDYTNYLWHILNHKVPLLWRFHLVHHTDPDLDVTTAFRFHFGEMIGSVFYRGSFVFLSGASPISVLIYEIFFETATQFHHSNWRLPYKLEKLLNRIIVTPRMHGIHHSIVHREMNSNFSVIFSFWDRLHNTVRLNIKQANVVTGIQEYENVDERTVGYLLSLPFTKIKKYQDDYNDDTVITSYVEKNNLGE